MKQMKRIMRLVLAGLLTAVSVSAAEPNTLYFMKYLPYRMRMNPALQPVCGTFVELPGISTIQVSAGNNALSMNDAVYLNDQKQMVTALHPDFGNRELLYAKLKRNERVYAEASLTVLGFGSRIAERGYFDFNVSVRADANVTVPRDLLKFALYGTPDTVGVNRYKLKSLAVEANAYLDLGGGYSHRINEHWSVGGRAHLLLGVANARARFSDLNINATSDYWQVVGAGKATVSMPSFKVDIDDEGHITKGGMETTDVDDILRNYEPSLGFAVDLGFEYKPVKSLSLSFSLKDVGFMSWQNATVAEGDIDYTFDGMAYRYNRNDMQQYGDSLAEAFRKSYVYSAETKRYFTLMNAKMYAAVEYSFLKDKMSLGLLSKTELVSGKLYEEITAAYNIRPCRWFGISASYSFFSGGFSSMGLGLNVRLTPFSFYLVGDYMPLHYTEQGIPYRAQAFNLQTGIVLTIGCKNKKFVPYFEQTDFAD